MATRGEARVLSLSVSSGTIRRLGKGDAIIRSLCRHTSNSTPNRSALKMPTFPAAHKEGLAVVDRKKNNGDTVRGRREGRKDGLNQLKGNISKGKGRAR